MTLQEAINRTDSIYPNQYTLDEKVAWLSYIDGMIFETVIKTHEADEEKEFIPYSCERLTEDLIAPAPFDEMYIAFLKTKIDESNGETIRYNNSASLFNLMLKDYRAWYNRNHLPLGRREIKYL